MKICRLLLFLCGVSAAAPPPQFFVAPDGSDSAAGTEDAPFATPYRGIAALAALCSSSSSSSSSSSIAGGGCASGAVLTLRAADYAIDRPLALSGVRGAAGAPILLRSAPGEVARLLGTARVQLAAPAPGDPALPLFSAATAARVLGAALPPGGDADAELYVRDTPQVRARWPDDAVARAWALRDPSVAARAAAACSPLQDEPYACAGWARTRPEDGWSWGSVRVSAAAPLLQWRSGNWSLHGLFTYDWADAASVVASVEPANGTVLFTQASWSAAGYWGGGRYFAEGAPEALDEAGEYWVDKRTARVYWLPPDGWPAGKSVNASWVVAAGPLLSIDSSAFVEVDGLLFSGTSGSLVAITNSSNVTVTRCALTGAGIRAVDAHDERNTCVTLSSNFVAHTGADSLWITGGNTSLLEPSRAVVEDNLILNFGRLGFAFNPAVGIDGVGTSCSHNLVAGGPACGLMFSGALQVVTFNIVSDALRSTFDVGVCCTGPRDWTAAGPVIAYNAFLRNGYTPLLSNHVSDPLRVGLYADYGNNAHSFTGNIVWQPPHPATPAPADVPRALATRSFGAYNHGGRNFAASYNIYIGINGSLANGGGLEGGDPAQLANGSHYFTALQTCGGHDAMGWRLPPCAALPGVAELAALAPAGGAAACALAARTCGAAPYNATAFSNAALQLPPGGVVAQGNDEGVPFTSSGTSASPDAQWFAAGASFEASLDFALLAGSPPLLAGTPQPPQDAWGPRWLQTGAWRDILWATVPWAVGDAPPGHRALDTHDERWWLEVAEENLHRVRAGSWRAPLA